MTMRIARADPFEGLEGIVRREVPLAKYTWNRIGGPAGYFIEPESIEQLRAAVLCCVEAELPIYVLGRGANLLVADDGVDGAVFHLSAPYWRHVERKGALLQVGAGMDLQKLVLHAVREGLAGLEGLAGIPATVGGAVRMNAGGTFGEIGAVVKSLALMDHEGEIHQLKRDEMRFGYRRSDIDAPFILEATLELEQDDPQALARRMKEVWMYKRNGQPLNARSAGCMFKNPPGHAAGQLIERAGLKGLRKGEAVVSDKHANFIVTHPGASADDVMSLLKIVRERVYAKFEITLEPEVRIWP